MQFCMKKGHFSTLNLQFVYFAQSKISMKGIIVFLDMNNTRSEIMYLRVTVFLQKIEISRTFLRAKQVGEKPGRFQFVVEITHKAVILILISL